MDIEPSKFGSKLIVLKIAINILDGFLYERRMFGVPISGPTRMFFDDESVVKHCSFPNLVLKGSIPQHITNFCEKIVSGKCLIYYEYFETNLTDLLIKFFH